MATNEMVGEVTQVLGSVVDVRFPPACVPEIFTAVEIPLAGQVPLVAETLLAAIAWLDEPDHELVEITRRLDERLGLAINLNNLGYNRLLLGQYAGGLHALQESITTAQGIGARHKQAFARLNYGLAYQLLGEPALARQELELAIRELERLRDR